jgi:NAD(P)-dependent dehydrogenase (short-subunit alcohol dehydrogenase family)
MYNLQNKVAIVTGAAGRKGLGRAIAQRLASEGADIALVDKVAVLAQDTDPGGEWRGTESTADDIRVLGRRALVLRCDISRSEEVDAMVKQTVSGLGKVDLLVNNAGLHIYAGITTITNEIWDKHLAVNLTGTFYCSRAVAREMVQKGAGGRIINIASALGKAGAGNGQLAYCASKFGVIGLTQCLALELAQHHILVNAVCPTLTDTGLHTDAFRDEARRKGLSIQDVRERVNEGFTPRVPLGRLGTSEDIANMVAFLASEESSFITGQSINVNVGFFTSL